MFNFVKHQFIMYNTYLKIRIRKVLGEYLYKVREHLNVTKQRGPPLYNTYIQLYYTCNQMRVQVSL